MDKAARTVENFPPRMAQLAKITLLAVVTTVAAAIFNRSLIGRARVAPLHVPAKKYVYLLHSATLYPVATVL